MLLNSSKIHTTVGATLGLSYVAVNHAELGRWIPAGVFVSGAGVGAVPPPPTFEEVTYEDGIVSVKLACTESVDFFSLTYSPTQTINIDNAITSGGGNFQIPVTVEVYLWGKTTRNGLSSGWVPYTGAVGGTGWETVCYDDIDSWTVYDSYPYLKEVWPTPISINGFVRRGTNTPPDIAMGPYSVYDLHQLGIFEDTSQKWFTEYGGRYTAYLRPFYALGWDTAYTGFIFKADVNALTTGLAGATFYLLRLKADNDPSDKVYVELCSVDTGVITVLSSYDLTSHLVAGDYQLFTFECIDNTFTVYLEGAAIWSTTDSSISSSSSRKYTGIWMRSEPGAASGYMPIYKEFKMESRLGSADPVSVDPGTPIDPITDEDGDPDVPIIVGPHLTFATHNANEDNVRLTLDDDRNPVVIVEDDEQTEIAALTLPVRGATFEDTKIVYYDETSNTLLTCAYGFGTLTDQQFLYYDSATGNILSAEVVSVWSRSGTDLYPTTDGDSVSLRDSAVAHGMTDIAETDAFLKLKILSATYGGVDIIGLSDGDATGLQVRGVIGTDDPTDSTPALMLVGSKMATASYDSYTKLLLHCEGADGSTTFTDSATGKTVTPNGDAHIEVDQYKFGSASAYFDGSGDYLAVDSADFDLSTGDFTIDFWLRYDGTANVYPCLFSNSAASWSANALSFAVDHVWSTGKVIFASYNFNLAAPMLVSTTTISTGVWYHVAVVRSGNTFKLYINGTAEDTETYAGAINFNYNGGMKIGWSWDGADGYYKGYLDEIRISKGIARWTADFDVPAAAYAGSSTTDAALADAETVLAVYNKSTKIFSILGDGTVELVMPLAGYVTTAGLTAGTIPKASDTHALADSLITESAAVVTVEGDLTLNADALGENRTLTIEGYDTGASAVRSHTISTNTSGSFVFTAANDEKHHFYSGSTSLLEVGLTTSAGADNCIHGYRKYNGARSVDHVFAGFTYTAGYNSGNLYHYAPTLKGTAVYQDSSGAAAIKMMGAIEGRCFVSNDMAGSSDGMMVYKSTLTTWYGVTIDVGYHYYAGFWNFATYGTVRNEYGFYCNTLVGTNKYSFYSLNGDVIFNDSGSAAIVRMEGDNDPNLFYLKGSTDFIGIGTNAPAAKLDVRGTVNVGVDDTGHDVTLYGATSGKYLLWDESENTLKINGQFEVNGTSQLNNVLTIGVDGTGYSAQFYGDTAGKYMLWYAPDDLLRVDGDFDLNGSATLGAASTDLLTCVGRLIVRTVNNAGMAATNGTVAEIVYNSNDSKFYGCTVTGTPATWSALN